MNKKTKLIGTALSLCVSLFMASCAQDGFDEESWQSSVHDAVLLSPESDAIVASKNADGSSWIITWPLVKGASGFKCTVKDVTDTANEPVVVFQDSIVDGCSLTFPRVEDTFYELEIQTIGNKALNNQDAEQSSLFAFNSFVPTWKTVPAGSDITTWLAANPIPDDYEGDVCINLEPGASYTMSGVVDFGSHMGTIRSTVATSPANIELTGGTAGFVIGDGFTLKNLNIDCSKSQANLITMSKNAKNDLIVGNNIYFVTEPIYMKNCTVDRLHTRFLYDNGVKYCAKTVIIDNCLVHLESTATSPFIEFYSGGSHVNDLAIRNSTIWNTGDMDMTYFVRYSNGGKSSDVGLTNASISYTNSTFYNISRTQQLGNYDGIAGSANFILKECVFVDCSGNLDPENKVSPGGVARYFLGRKTSPNAVFRNNTYWFGNADMSVDGYDNTGTAILGNPGFTNPTGDVKSADFHMSGAAQNSAKIGDPRWLD
ncbi:MAG: DUF4992 family lipoprotein [Bacteroidales bacterium]|nr:DUF4992 family lipoprotein [Bacteroidales bacterium]MCM1147173.1 DUF4992 family lipoprotein [Bacteroidales bacterium]MCM1205399.1 DUF4992 family lipoprotein [Bacillota bacterium]MCM1509796.1 DUF4992 family lipoprotein [Clostridium sp.]